jgi:hypothetical protein
VQQRFNLSDPGAEELLYESAAVHRFVGVDLSIAPAQDAAPHAQETAYKRAKFKDGVDELPKEE